MSKICKFLSNPLNLLGCALPVIAWWVGWQLAELSSPSQTEFDSSLQNLNTLVLEKENTLILNGAITDALVADIQYKLHKMSYRLPLDTPIILVINTPGGSLLAGHRLMVTMGAVPQPVHTLVVAANSMGFYIAQAGKIRYATPTSYYMAHRAVIMELSGEVGGELNSRLLQLIRSENFLQFITAQRMGMDVATFKELIRDEYSFSGFDAIENNSADEIVQPLCGTSLLHKVEVITSPTVKAIFYSCPLFLK